MTEDFNDLDIEMEEPEMDEIEEKLHNGPKMGDPEWNDFVMGLLTDDEFSENEETGNKHPCCHGLRRVANILLGKTTGGVKDIIYPDSNDPRRVVVVYELVVGDPMEGVPQERYIDVSDASRDNTDPFFLEHAVATASTKAQARCLRNALLIKTVTADEIKKSDRAKIMGLDVREDTQGDYNDDEVITSRQKGYIDTIAKKADVDVKKLVESLDNMDPKHLTKADGRKLGKMLDDYRGGREDVPEEVKGYDGQNW